MTGGREIGFLIEQLSPPPPSWPPTCELVATLRLKARFVAL